MKEDRDEIIDFLAENAQDLQRQMTYYKCAIMEIETKFKVLDEEYSLQHDRNPIISIKSRLKEFPSIFEKIERKGYELSAESISENLNDIAGIRVICSFEEDVYTLADALLRQDDITLLQIKDYIKEPKDNGYRSLHLIVAVPIFLGTDKKMMKVEIQLRTIAMDCWATLEHQLRYKKNNKSTEQVERELYECAIISTDLDARMDHLRESMIDEEE